MFTKEYNKYFYFFILGWLLLHIWWAFVGVAFVGVAFVWVAYVWVAYVWVAYVWVAYVGVAFVGVAFVMPPKRGINSYLIMKNDHL